MELPVSGLNFRIGLSDLYVAEDILGIGDSIIVNYDNDINTTKITLVCGYVFYTKLAENVNKAFAVLDGVEEIILLDYYYIESNDILTTDDSANAIKSVTILSNTPQLKSVV